jgi:hypothetical protein
MELETVKIVDSNKRGFKTINKSDYDEKEHKLYKAKTTRKTTRKPKAD